MSRAHAIKKNRYTSTRLPPATSWDRNMRQLRQVENRMDGLFRQIVDQLDRQQTASALDRMDTLVAEFPGLRLSSVAQYPEHARSVIACLEPEMGPVSDFRDAVERLCRACITPQAVRGLRSRLYSVAAHVAESCPELLATVALAVLSLDAPDPAQHPFLEMVVCASALEWFVESTAEDAPVISPDVSSWLAAEPSAALRAAVGEGLAYYYASIPGALTFLDRQRVLFDERRLDACLRQMSLSSRGEAFGLLGQLADSHYLVLLRTELKRVQSALRGRYPSAYVADIEMLIGRALEAVDDLPPQVNPLLQAILIQSWVRYVETH